MKLIPIEGNTGYYVTRYGEVFSTKISGFRTRKLYLREGYQRVGIRILGSGKIYLVHRLVAMTFIPNPENKPEVNHINGIKDDNNIENLEWCTGEENRAHALANNLAWVGKAHPTSKQVGQYTKEGVLIKVWGSIGEASRFGFLDKRISGCINGRCKTHRGYVWKEQDKAYTYRLNIGGDWV